MQNENTHIISLEQAVALTTRFRAHRPTELPLCETFSKAAVINLLEQIGAKKMRIYLGEKEDGKVCTILVAVNQFDQDIISFGIDITSTDQGIILQDAIRCPELCPPPSPLNE